MVTSLEYAKISVNQYIVFNYRPQGSCEGYVFTPVILFTGGSASVHAGIPPPRKEAPPPPREAAAADGTYPTGMHSCLEFS